MYPPYTVRATLYGGPIDGDEIQVWPDRILRNGVFAYFNYRFAVENGCPTAQGQPTGFRVMWALYEWSEGDRQRRRGWHYAWKMGCGWRNDAVNANR